MYIDLLYTLLNITTLTSAQWYLGLPFGYPVNVTGIVEMAKIYEDVLGDNLIALQLGELLKICFEMIVVDPVLTFIRQRARSIRTAESWASYGLSGDRIYDRIRHS